MSGMIGRMIAQVVMVGFNIATKAFVQAYQQAKSGGGGPAVSAMRSASSRMALDQAKEVLNLQGQQLTRDLILRQFMKYFEANDPDKGGSFYLQSKINNAKEVLLDEIKRQQQEAAAKASAEAASSSKVNSFRFNDASQSPLASSLMRMATPARQQSDMLR